MATIERLPLALQDFVLSKMIGLENNLPH